MIFKKIGRSVFTVGEEGALKKEPWENWPLGTESRRTGSTGPKGGTTAPHRAPLQRLSIGTKTRGTGSTGPEGGTSGPPEKACQRLAAKPAGAVLPVEGPVLPV